jgi:hypothetical protein
MPVPREGEALVRNLWLSLDPYMRGRMSDAKSYVAGVGLGEVMVGQTVGEVLESRDPGLRPGDKVVTSGDAEAFPPGLPIGQVARVEEGLVDVEPFVVRDKIQHVRVADYGLNGILAQQTPAKTPEK